MAGIVEAIHHAIATDAFRGCASEVQALNASIPAVVYESIRMIASVVNWGSMALIPLLPASKKRLFPAHEAALAALNGIVGDYLAQADNPLAIPMALRYRGRAFRALPINLEPQSPQLYGDISIENPVCFTLDNRLAGV